MENKFKDKRILVAPLDWGLGHASRCIPVIQELIAQGAQVIIGADKQPMKLLKNEFPDCEAVRVPGMNISYPKHLSMSTFMALKAPHFFQTISKEQENLKLIVENYKIDGVISDNRYGLYNKDKPSILITHQLFIQAPIFKNLLKKLTAKYISKYYCCWIPDIQGENNLSGILSHQSTNLKNLRFVGPLSRFMNHQNDSSKNQKFKRELMIVLSGPEPTRSQFEKLILNQLKHLDIEALLVRGIVENSPSKKLNKKGKIQVKNHLSSKEMLQEIQDSEIILCRSGYSSVMDLAVINKKAIIVPTNGQTEQEYLAKHLSNNKFLYSTTEKDLNLTLDIKKAKKYNGFNMSFNQSMLKEAVYDFLKQC